MSWFSRSRREPAVAQAETAPEVYKSLGLTALLESMRRKGQGLRILDLGSAVGGNVEFLSQIGCKLHIGDLYASRSTAMELIATINPRVWLGHFELWEDGEIIFRHGMALMTGEQPSLAQAAAMIDVSVEAADRFLPAFDFLLRGAKTPQEAIAACMFETVGEA